MAMCLATVIANPRHRRGGSGEDSQKGPCKVVDAAGVVTEEACSHEETCTAGPIVATINGEAHDVFFCYETESSESSEEVPAVPTAADLDELAGALSCNACELTVDTVVTTPNPCVAPLTCTVGPVTTVVGGVTNSAMFCSVPAADTFSLLTAFQCPAVDSSSSNSSRKR